MIKKIIKNIIYGRKGYRTQKLIENFMCYTDVLLHGSLRVTKYLMIDRQTIRMERFIKLLARAKNDTRR